MKITNHYRVADFPFRIVAEAQILERLNSFDPFKVDGVCSDVLFNVNVESSSSNTSRFPGMEADEDLTNDFGRICMYHDEDCYFFEVMFRDSHEIHTMTVNKAFTQSTILLNSSDIYRTYALVSLLHIMFSMAIIPQGGIMTHASCVTLDGKGYMFLGKSGTGKSTHAALWLQNFDGCSLLNDDNPVIRDIDGTIQVYGSPWSGKTPCYKNVSAPLGGIVRLEQAKHNRFIQLSEASAFACLLPSCSVIQSDSFLTECVYRTVIAVCERTVVGLLQCLPDRDAAFLCRDSLCKIK